MSFLYWFYSNMFWCKRSCIRMFFQEDEPRKTLEVIIPRAKYPWIFIAAVMNDELEIDVTDAVEKVVTPGEVLTPTRLVEITGRTDVLRWEYLNTETLETEVISSDGLVNEVKPHTD